MNSCMINSSFIINISFIIFIINNILSEVRLVYLYNLYIISYNFKLINRDFTYVVILNISNYINQSLPILKINYITLVYRFSITLDKFSMLL
jgi:hypothetical protein